MTGLSDFLSHILSGRGIGALVAIKLNPGISKSSVEPRTDSYYRECGPSTAQYYLRRLEYADLIVNRQEGDISHLFLTDKGERFLDMVIRIYCEFSPDHAEAEDVWRHCRDANDRAKGY